MKGVWCFWRVLYTPSITEGMQTERPAHICISVEMCCSLSTVQQKVCLLTLLFANIAIPTV